MKKCLSAIAFLYFFCSSAFASPIDELNEMLGSFKTLTGDFEQVLSSDKGRVLQESTGKVMIARPGKFRWDQTSPIKQLIIVSGDDVTIFDPELEQVSIRSLAHSLDVAPALLLSGSVDKLDALFNVTQVESADPAETWFKLSSKDADSLMSVVVLGFKFDKISAMQMRDNIGHVTEVRFSNVLINSPLSDILFEFTAPDGVDVMYE